MAFLVLTSIIIVIWILIKKIYKLLNDVPPVPTLDDVWWGAGPQKPEDTDVKPFQISIDNNAIDDLKHRLENRRPIQPALENIDHQYGINAKLVEEIADYWLNNYNWRERERFLNQYPQFKTKIQGLNIHFIHKKPENPEGLPVIPLLILHGWPGSVREFYEMIPILTTPQKGRIFVFEVVAPSLPGYGFSDPAVRQGLGPPQIAVIMKTLMTRLKFDKFYIQAGDWGSIVMSYMSILYPEHVIAIHNNMCMDFSIKSILKRLIYGFWPSLIVEKEYEHLVYPTTKFLANMLERTGYFHLQATRPDTVGVALSDSPIGLAAYILEKFIDKNGKLTDKFTMEKLLDNVTIYWFTNSITTAMRLYAEAYSKKTKGLKLEKIPIPVPTGCARLKYDMAYFPTTLLKNKYPRLIHVTDLELGHFAAFENPSALATDLYNFIEKAQYL